MEPRTNSSNRRWECKKESVRRDLDAATAKSRVFKVLDVSTRSDEVRAVVCYEIATLVPPLPDGTMRVDGPVIVGLRYARRFLGEPPLPWEVATVLCPQLFHPNCHASGGLCLGEQSVFAGFTMAAVVHLVFASLTFTSFNTREWEGLNPNAARYVRDHASAFPLFSSGLFEEPPPAMKRPLAAAPLPFLLLGGLGGRP
jgi:hypothetical protein